MSSIETKNIDGDGQTKIIYKYTRNKYTVTFDSKGGTSVESYTNYYKGDIVKPKANSPI